MFWKHKSFEINFRYDSKMVVTLDGKSCRSPPIFSPLMFGSFSVSFRECLILLLFLRHFLAFVLFVRFLLFCFYVND